MLLFNTTKIPKNVIFNQVIIRLFVSNIVFRGNIKKVHFSQDETWYYTSCDCTCSTLKSSKSRPCLCHGLVGLFGLVKWLVNTVNISAVVDQKYQTTDDFYCCRSREGTTMNAFWPFSRRLLLKKSLYDLFFTFQSHPHTSLPIASIQQQ